MRSRHEDIGARLPDYLNNTLRGEERSAVWAHIQGCEECREELSVLKELLSIESACPGDHFFSILPGNIAARAEGQKPEPGWLRGFFSPLPVVIAAMAIFFVLFSFHKRESRDFEIPVASSGAFPVLDYSGLTEKDIPVFTDRIPDSETLFRETAPDGGYLKEFANLSRDEMARLEAILGSVEKGG